MLSAAFPAATKCGYLATSSPVQLLGEIVSQLMSSRSAKYAYYFFNAVVMDRVLRTGWSAHADTIVLRQASNRATFWALSPCEPSSRHSERSMPTMASTATDWFLSTSRAIQGLTSPILWGLNNAFGKQQKGCTYVPVMNPPLTP